MQSDMNMMRRRSAVMFPSVSKDFASQIISACVEYLEAVPWEESEEEEILKIIPGMGSLVEPILARLQPVNHSGIRTQDFPICSSIGYIITPCHMNDLKTSAQEQLEYMLTEDDDAPLLSADEVIKIEVLQSANRMLMRFKNLVESLLCDRQESVSGTEELQLFQLYTTDLSWACQILAKLECVKRFCLQLIGTSYLLQIQDCKEKACLGWWKKWYS